MTDDVWRDGELATADLGADAEPAHHPPTPRRRRLLAVAGVLGVLLLAALFVTWGGKAPASTTPYDPDNPTYNGSQALARVLASHGIPVTVAHGESELGRAPIDADTTVLVTASAELREATITSMARTTHLAGRLVLVSPERRVVRQLAPNVAMRDVAHLSDALVSDCNTPFVHPGERLSRSQSEYQHPSNTGGCFVNDGYAVHLTLPAGSGVAPLVLVGSSDLVANDRIAQEDNAAVMIRTLGQGSRLVWYMPDLRDVPSTSRDAADRLWPEWLGPMVLLCCFAVGAVVLWRARRLGRLVVEPLPVVVRAIETTESRGRIYRRARDTNRVAAVLRQASARRLRAGLALPSATPDEPLFQAVSEATGRPLDAVRMLLAGPAPVNDTDLLRLAAALASLEKEIRPT